MLKKEETLTSSHSVNGVGFHLSQGGFPARPAVGARVSRVITKLGSRFAKRLYILSIFPSTMDFPARTQQPDYKKLPLDCQV